MFIPIRHATTLAMQNFRIFGQLTNRSPSSITNQTMQPDSIRNKRPAGPSNFASSTYQAYDDLTEWLSSSLHTWRSALADWFNVNFCCISVILVSVFLRHLVLVFFCSFAIDFGCETFFKCKALWSNFSSFLVSLAVVSLLAVCSSLCLWSSLWTSMWLRMWCIGVVSLYHSPSSSSTAQRTRKYLWKLND